MKKTLKLVAALLSVIIITQSFTAVAFAAEESKFTTESPYSRTVDPVAQGSEGSAQLPEAKDSNAQIITEIPEKRTESTKTFLMSDGSFMLAAYNEPVHYKDDEGVWQDIDNTLSLESDTITDDLQPAQSAVDSQPTESTVNSKPAESAVDSQPTESTVDSKPAESTVDSQLTGSTVDSKPAESVVASQPAGSVADSEPAESSVVTQPAKNAVDTQQIVSALDTQQMVNKAGRIKIKFAKKIKPAKTVSLKAGDYTVSWGIDGVTGTNLEVIPQKSPDKSESHNDQFLNLKKLNNQVLYRDALPGADVQYLISSNSVKENIILKTKDAQKQFTETYQTGNLVAKQINSKTIDLFEPEDTKQTNPVYAISAPQMTDANGEISSAISIGIVYQGGGTLKVSIHTDESWLLDATRAYPVTVDPQVETPKGTATIRDTFVSSGTNYHNVAGISNTMGTLYIGNETANYKLCRILLNFTLPQFNKGDMIVNATLNLAQRSDGLNPSTSTMQINAYAMNSAWNETTVTWDNSLAAVTSATGGPALDYFTASQSTANTYNYWDITKLAKGWYSGSIANNGIVLKAPDETTAVRNIYYASNYSSGEKIYPVLSINYLNNAGLEDYWSYHSQSAGRAGTSSVNDYTGNLVHSVPIMNTTGEKAPLDFSIVYNGYQTGTHYQDNQRGLIYGWGWQGNFSQRVDAITESSGTNDVEKAKFKLLASFGYKYIYQDEDGTEHYFITDPNKTSRIIDEDGLGLEITSGGTADEYYTIKYSDGSRKTFTSSGYLRGIYDSENNSLMLSYYGAYLTGITDGANRTTTITRSEYGSITDVTGPDGKNTHFDYYGGNLTAITYPDSKAVHFTYNANNQLETAVNVDGTYLKYEYYTGSNPMVINRAHFVSEFSADSVIGNKAGFIYNNDNSTTFEYIKAGQTEAQAQKETYNFDNVGKTTSVVNMDGSANTYTYTKYTDNTKKDAKANKMTSQAEASAPVVNLLLDHNAELNNGTWTGSNWSTPGGVFSVDSTVAYLGTKSLKITQNQTSPARSGAVQVLTNLTPGTVYTLSAYVKTSSVTSGLGANLYTAFSNGTTSLGTINGTGLFGTNDWQRISLTFTVPAGATKAEIYGGLSYSNGTAWFDCFQLETGNVPNIYNMLENSDFRYSTNYLPDRWSVSNFTSGDGMSGGWLKMYGNAGLNKNICQNVYINRPANSAAFVVSGKSTGHSVPTQRGGRYYAVDVGMYFTDGTSQWNVIDFNPDANNVQFTSGAVAASVANQSKTISYLQYYIIYYKNANDATFKYLQLNMDETGTTYTYTNDGKLETSAQNAKNTGAYIYSDAKELTSATTSNSASSFSQNYTYIYESQIIPSGNSHRLMAARSTQTGTGFAFGYDGSGNVTNTKMGTVSAAGVLDTNAPYIESTQSYNADGNYVTGSTDQRGNTTAFDVDSTTGLTNSVTDPKGNVTGYTYNPDNNLLTAIRAQSSAGAVENTYTYDVADRLNKITHNGFDYNFTRDGYGNTTAIDVGTQNLITNSFAAGNGNLLSSTYGNSFKLGYGYDGYDRVTSVTKNSATAYLYTYDARGNLAKITDKTSGTDVVSNFAYDVGDRLIRKSSSDGSAIKYSYDNMDRSTNVSYTFGGQTKQASYNYSSDNRKNTSSLLDNNEISYAYDSLNRETTTSVGVAGMFSPSLSAKRSFVTAPGSNATTTLIDTFTNIKNIPMDGTTNTLSKYHYTYDDNGNILTATDKDGYVTTYTYDGLNQLTMVEDEKTITTTYYTYDAGGNITNRTVDTGVHGSVGAELENVNYTYGDANWKDLLTSYNGQNITYDATGNPLSYRNGMNFTWEGRQLKTAVANGKNISYTYNSDGIRTGKTVDGVATKYFLDDSTILAQQTGSDVLWFLYESDGTRVGFTYNGTSYYYTKNAQGDVTGIVDSDYNTVVQYSYDAWGKLLSTTGSLASTIGKQNPFLYRGYYYDVETGLYYLNSRYYDPQTGRFVSADDTDVFDEDQGNSTENNLFAYCLNNPVNMVDDEGTIAWWIAAAVGGALFDSTIYCVGAAINGNFSWKALGKAALVGAVTGVTFGAIGKGIKIASGAVKASKALNAIKVTKVAAISKAIAQPIKKVAGKISGYTKHGLAQVMGRDGGRGVKASSILDTVRNPVKITKQENGAIKYVGKQAVVVLNEAGKVITGYAKSSKYWR